MSGRDRVQEASERTAASTDDRLAVGADSSPPLLEVHGLTVEFSSRRHRILRAVDDVTFSMGDRETVGIVGESGSGKTTLARAILGLAPIAAGTVALAGEAITHASPRRRRQLSTELQAVFQDPYSSLSPTRTIHATLAEALGARAKHRKDHVERRVQQMLARVGLPPDAAQRYPSHFSGGQRQRIAIARALMVEPRLVICDEPTSALDLSVQAQILNLLCELQVDLGVSYLFISHDLAVVRHVSHRIIVLFQGRVMEAGAAAPIYESPRHPYTRALLAAAPVPDPAEQRARRARRLEAQRADTALGLRPEMPGCPFAARCPHAAEICHAVMPNLEKTESGIVACHRWRELDAGQLPERQVV